MDTVWIPVGIVVAHYVGDYILQTEEMATRKFFDVSALLSHTLVYSVAIAIFGTILYTNDFVSAGEYARWVFINFVLHTITDYYTAPIANKLSNSREFEKGYFFKFLGFDQLIHMLCLFVTFYAIMG